MKLLISGDVISLQAPLKTVSLHSIMLLMFAFLSSIIPMQGFAQNTKIVQGANLAYYFDDSGTLLVIENVNQLPRKIVVHSDADKIDSWGLQLINKSTCGSFPMLSGDVPIPSTAKVVVYANVGPAHITVLGIEDPASAMGRTITVQPEDSGGACCCTRIPCNSKLCCPPGCPTSC